MTHKGVMVFLSLTSRSPSKRIRLTDEQNNCNRCVWPLFETRMGLSVFEPEAKGPHSVSLHGTPIRYGSLNVAHEE